MGDACRRSNANAGEAKVMYQCERLAGLQTKKQNKTPTPFHWRREIHPLDSPDYPFLYDDGIISQRRHPRTRYGTGNDVCHVPWFIRIRRHLVARAWTIDGNAARLFRKGSL